MVRCQDEVRGKLELAVSRISLVAATYENCGRELPEITSIIDALTSRGRDEGEPG